MKNYKVLTQKDKWFSGRFDAATLEKVLNELAADGWRVVSMVSSSREGLVTGGAKDELIILLEKDTPAKAAREIAEPDSAGVYRL